MKLNISTFGKNLTLLSIMAASLGIVPALAEETTSKMTVLGGLNFYSSNAQSNNTSLSSLTDNSKMSIGGGILLNPGMFEIGLIYVNRNNEYDGGLFKFDQSSSWLQVPFGLKIRLANIITVGGGGYAWYRFTDYSNTFTLGTSGSGLNLDTGNRQRFELGYYVSAGVAVPLDERFGIIAEARLVRGLTNLSEDSSTTIRSADFQTFAGVQFGY